MLNQSRDYRLLAALALNAVLLCVLCIELAPRSAASTAVPTGDLQGMPSGDVVVMPAQLSTNIWGCYLLDKTRHSLSVYQYSPGERMLRLMAGRDVQYDTRLADFNTQPSPTEIKDILDRAAGGSAESLPKKDR